MRRRRCGCVGFESGEGTAGGAGRGGAGDDEKTEPRRATGDRDDTTTSGRGGGRASGRRSFVRARARTCAGRARRSCRAGTSPRARRRAARRRSAIRPPARRRATRACRPRRRRSRARTCTFVMAVCRIRMGVPEQRQECDCQRTARAEARGTHLATASSSWIWSLLVSSQPSVTVGHPRRPRASYLATASISRSESSATESFASSCAWFTSAAQSLKPVSKKRGARQWVRGHAELVGPRRERDPSVPRRRPVARAPARVTYARARGSHESRVTHGIDPHADPRAASVRATRQSHNGRATADVCWIDPPKDWFSDQTIHL